MQGRGGLFVTRPRYSSSFSISRPAADLGRNAVMPTVEAGAAVRVPKASLT